MKASIKKQIIFALENDNEVMAALLEPDSFFDEENKQMNRELIKKNETIISKVNKGLPLTEDDLDLIRYANEIDVNDSVNTRGHHKEALELGKWLEQKLVPFSVDNYERNLRGIQEYHRNNYNSCILLSAPGSQNRCKRCSRRRKI